MNSSKATNAIATRWVVRNQKFRAHRVRNASPTQTASWPRTTYAT
ncbi:MAG TPA: hypothetical protein VM597_19390 [Gemmataceae bacterium]|nr:hypothetical protein [Gemmataceae bacterium]